MGEGNGHATKTTRVTNHYIMVAMEGLTLEWMDGSVGCKR